MNITVTINGDSVTLVGIEANGDDIYLQYIDGSQNLLTTKIFVPPSQLPYLIGTGAVIN